MCSYWNVSHATFYRRICAGRSIEKALAPTGRMGGNAVRDHKGKEYRTQTEMCKAYGILKQTYSRRVIAGYTVEEALTIPLDRKRSIDQTLRKMHKPSSSTSGKLVHDHKGNEYASIKDLAQAYDIAPNLIYAAIYRGKTPAKAVSDELKARKKMTAPDGKVYGSVSEMAAAYGVSPANFRARLKAGYTVKEALLLPLNPTKREKAKMRSRQINKGK